MYRVIKNSIAATAGTGFSLAAWSLCYTYSDWAIFLLLPFAAFVALGTWSLTLHPWRARLNIALRADSPLGRTLTGKIRAAGAAAALTCAAALLLGWLTIDASAFDWMLLMGAFFLSGCIYSISQHLLRPHLHEPFARSVSTVLGTWIVAVPLTLGIAYVTWSSTVISGAILDASLREALQIGLEDLPERTGWITYILAFLQSSQFAKLWLVVQLKDFPVAGFLFSLDAALFSFVLCRTAIVVTQVIEMHIDGDQE